jgi:hypothetical protein
VTGGTFTLTQSGTTPSFTNTGTVAISATRTWTVNGGSLVLTGGTTSGLGTLDLNGVAVTFSTSAVTTLLNFDAATTVAGNLITIGSSQLLRMVGGTVTADVTVASGGFDDSRGAVNQNGTLTVPTGGTLHLQGTPGYGTSTFTLLNGYTNSGTLLLSDSSGHAVTMAITNGSLTHPVGGTFTMTGSGTRTLALQLVNQGTMNLTDNLTLAKASAAHANSGTINVNAGTFTLNQSGTAPSFVNTGIVNIAAGRTWNVTGGSLGIATGATIGDGVIDLNGVATTFSTTAVKAYLNTDATTTFGGNLITVAANDSLRMVGGTMTAAVSVQNIGMYYVQGAVTQQGALTLPSGSSLKLDGNPTYGTAALTVASGFTNSGFLDMSSTLGHAATLTITTGALTHASGATFFMSGTGTRTINADLINQGTFSPSLTMSLNGQLTNQGTLTLPTNVGLTIAKASAAHANSGTISLPGGTGGILTVTQSGTTPSFTNTGTISVNAGRSWVVTGGTVTNASSPAVGTISGSGGTLNFTPGSFTNNGIIAPGGAGAVGMLTYTGAFTPGTTGTINLEVGSGTRDLLAITGAATLGGNLNISALAGYTPSGTAPHTLMTYTSKSGGTFVGSTVKPAICPAPTEGATTLTITC